jgi:CRP/FNR family transcriptional regulator
MDKSALAELHVLVEHVGPLHEGEPVFRQGAPFEAIAAVRAGTVKTSFIDRSGREQVLGFHFPGEVIGLDAIDGNVYPCTAVALDTVMLCRFSFPRMALLASRLPGLQSQLFRLMSRGIGRAGLMAGDSSAEERVTAFLVGISRRLEARGFSPSRFQLTMARADIANHLRMTPETVSRMLKRLQDAAMIEVRGREVEILDRPGLDALAVALLDH